jgi:GGDEF domain-containing protein
LECFIRAKSPNPPGDTREAAAHVTAFLDAAKELGVRSENEYGAARLCQIIGNWFGGTLSIGIATIVPTAQHRADLVRAADESLYEAKRKGRDRIEIGTP